jgi:hypothetical protein
VTRLETMHISIVLCRMTRFDSTSPWCSISNLKHMHSLASTEFRFMIDNQRSGVRKEMSHDFCMPCLGWAYCKIRPPTKSALHVGPYIMILIKVKFDTGLFFLHGRISIFLQINGKKPIQEHRLTLTCPCD